MPLVWHVELKQRRRRKMQSFFQAVNFLLGRTKLIYGVSAIVSFLLIIQWINWNDAKFNAVVDGANSFKAGVLGTVFTPIIQLMHKDSVSNIVDQHLNKGISGQAVIFLGMTLAIGMLLSKVLARLGSTPAAHAAAAAAAARGTPGGGGAPGAPATPPAGRIARLFDFIGAALGPIMRPALRLTVLFGLAWAGYWAYLNLPVPIQNTPRPATSVTVPSAPVVPPANLPAVDQIQSRVASMTPTEMATTALIDQCTVTCRGVIARRLQGTVTKDECDAWRSRQPANLCR